MWEQVARERSRLRRSMSAVSLAVAAVGSRTLTVFMRVLVALMVAVSVLLVSVRHRAGLIQVRVVAGHRSSLGVGLVVPVSCCCFSVRSDGGAFR
jgi:hypothetical protein